MSPKLSSRAIRAMPYESRLKRYNDEKNELILNHPGKPGDWIEEELKKLREKWRI